MCGRYTLAVSEDELSEYITRVFDIADLIPDLALPRYNIAPGDRVLAVIHDGEHYRLGYLRWDFPIGGDHPNFMINARAETIDTKYSFQNALAKRRCVILANGFYEWKKDHTGRHPYHFSLKTGEIFGFAGVYSPSVDASGQKVFGCAIITTGANDLMEPIHERMPVILSPFDMAEWLYSKNQDAPSLKRLLRAYPSDAMMRYGVDTAVNDPTHDQADCLNPAITGQTEASLHT